MSDLDDHAPDGYYPYWEDDKPPKTYTCGRCGKRFKTGNQNIACAVLHAPGTCCHYSGTEIKPKADKASRNE